MSSGKAVESDDKKMATNRKAFLSRTVAALGYFIAIVGSLQIAWAPVVPFIVHVPYIFPQWVIYSLWICSYFPTCWLMLKLSRVRFGVFVILIATMFSFALTETLYAQFGIKYEHREAK